MYKMYKIKPTTSILEKIINSDTVNTNTANIHTNKLIVKYIKLKTDYETKVMNIESHLYLKIKKLKDTITYLKKKKELEHKIKHNFIFKIENIIIVKNTTIESSNIKHYDDDNDDDDNIKSTYLYLYLNPVYATLDTTLYTNLYTNLYTSIKINNTLKNLILTLHNDNFKEKNTLNYQYENEFNYNYDLLELCNIITDDSIGLSYNKNNKNPICKLLEFQKCQKILQQYNKYYINQIEKNVNKNKIFNIQLKECKETTKQLLNKKEAFQSTLLELRNDKIAFYNNTNKNIIKGFISNLLNNKANLSSINEFFFFDTKEIFNIIDSIKTIDLELNKVNHTIKTIEHIKHKYNSEAITDLHFNIKNNKNDYGNNYGNNYGNDYSNNYSSQYTKERDYSVAFDYIKNNGRLYKNKECLSYPIIINNIVKFKHFENDINMFFINNIKKQIELCNDNIMYLDIKIHKYNSQLNYLLDKQKNINVNRELYNNYIYYNNKLNKMETLILHYL